jgi:hypothetical protein
MNITQLAKECGARENKRTYISDDGWGLKETYTTSISFKPSELTAFANAIIEECAVVGARNEEDRGARKGGVIFADGQCIADAIRALKEM